MKTAFRAAGVCLAIAALAVGALLALLFVNLRSYARLVYEEPVATVEFQERGPQRYLAVVTREPAGAQQTFELGGDEWQVDARVLKFTGLANLLGLRAQYRLERLSGRYLDIQRERTAPHSVYSLHEESALDLWNFAKAHPSWVPFVDGYYGSATYLPMAAGARYEVHMTPSGLIARPDNEAAKAASHAWRMEP